MDQQIIDIETNHGTWIGDLFPVAFSKCNDNFTELFARGGANMLINCGVPINQRGFAGGALAAGSYGYDRWKAGAGGCNVTINAATGVFNHSSGPLQQIVEVPQMAWGQPLTVSVEDPSGPVMVSVGGATGSIPAGAGRRGVTLTPVGSGHLVVQLTATGVTYSRPKLERGPVATRFVPVPQALELMLCQRYCQKSFPLNEAPGNNSSTSHHRPTAAYNSQGLRTSVQFPVQMRAAPTVAFYSGSEGGNLSPVSSWRYFDVAAGVWRAAASMSLVATFATGFIVDCVSTGFNVAGSYLVAGQYVADAEV